MFNQFQNVDFSLFTVPAQKITDLNVATFNAAFEAQQAAAKSLVSLTEERSKAAMEIKDFDGFVAFAKAQGEIAQSSAQTLAEDSKVVVANAQTYFAAVQSILTDSQEAVKATVSSLSVVPAAPAKKAVAKKAA